VLDIALAFVRLASLVTQHGLDAAQSQRDGAHAVRRSIGST